MGLSFGYPWGDARKLNLFLRPQGNQGSANGLRPSMHRHVQHPPRASIPPGCQPLASSVNQISAKHAPQPRPACPTSSTERLPALVPRRVGPAGSMYWRVFACAALQQQHRSTRSEARRRRRVAARTRLPSGLRHCTFSNHAILPLIRYRAEQGNFHKPRPANTLNPFQRPFRRSATHLNLDDHLLASRFHTDRTPGHLFLGPATLL